MLFDKWTYVEVLRVQLLMLGQVEILLRDHHTLTEEVLVDLLTVGLRNQPRVRISIAYDTIRQQVCSHLCGCLLCRNKFNCPKDSCSWSCRKFKPAMSVSR